MLVEDQSGPQSPGQFERKGKGCGHRLVGGQGLSHGEAVAEIIWLFLLTRSLEATEGDINASP